MRARYCEYLYNGIAEERFAERTGGASADSSVRSALDPEESRTFSSQRTREAALQALSVIFA